MNQTLWTRGETEKTRKPEGKKGMVMMRSSSPRLRHRPSSVILLSILLVFCFFLICSWQQTGGGAHGLPAVTNDREATEQAVPVQTDGDRAAPRAPPQRRQQRSARSDPSVPEKPTVPADTAAASDDSGKAKSFRTEAKGTGDQATERRSGKPVLGPKLSTPVFKSDDPEMKKRFELATEIAKAEQLRRLEAEDHPHQQRRNQRHHPRRDPNRIIQHGSHTHTQADVEANSGLIFGVLFTTMIVSQLLVMLWKKFHERSFNNFTLFGLWVIPAGWSLWQGFWRFLIFWLLFSGRTAVVLRAATRRPLDRNAPKIVYSWFFFLYRVCYAVAGFGYTLVMLEFFGVFHFLEQQDTVQGWTWREWLPSPILVLFYGLYFGVLGRDLALLCTSTLASKLGYYSKDGIPNRVLAGNICAICDTSLLPTTPGGGAGNAELQNDPSSSSTTEGQTMAMNSLDSGGALGANLRAVGLQAHLKSHRPGKADELSRGSEGQRIFTLTCGHRFHEYCIRGRF